LVKKYVLLVPARSGMVGKHKAENKEGVMLWWHNAFHPNLTLPHCELDGSSNLLLQGDGHDQPPTVCTIALETAAEHRPVVRSLQSNFPL